MINYLQHCEENIQSYVIDVIELMLHTPQDKIDEGSKEILVQLEQRIEGMGGHTMQELVEIHPMIRIAIEILSNHIIAG